MKKLRLIPIAAACLVFGACSSNSGGGFDRVLQDFGLQERQEGYESGADRVLERLAAIGQTELKRLNSAMHHGEIQFDESAPLHGKYYKEVKVYDRSQPLDANPVGKTANRKRGFVGHIEYTYRIYRSPMKSTRAEASAQSASIPTGKYGGETYRYHFNSSSSWNGAKGELVRR